MAESAFYLNFDLVQGEKRREVIRYDITSRSNHPEGKRISPPLFRIHMFRENEIETRHTQTSREIM